MLKGFKEFLARGNIVDLAVAVANTHGTVTGAAGGVLLRPFARLISGTGDSVTTYGEPWNMN